MPEDEHVRVFHERPVFSREQKAALWLLMTFGTLAFVFGMYAYYKTPLDVTMSSADISQTTILYDRTGQHALYEIHGEENRKVISHQEIPDSMRLATIAAEDNDFYKHHGIKITSILRALKADVASSEMQQGGSTITQQLVKNALLTPEKTLSRKIKEIILAIEVELTYSKDQILEMYLNEVSYGGTAYGIQEAAQYYFGKDVGKLSLTEAAYLAGLPKSPTKFSPFGETPETGIGRQKDVIRLMTVNKFITQEIKEGAEGEKLTFASPKIDIKAPHFVMYVQDLLARQYGASLVEQGGLEVTTSLDWQLQQQVQ